MTDLSVVADPAAVEATAIAETDLFGPIRPVTPEAFFARSEIESGLHVLAYGPVKLPLLVRNRGASATFYGFHGAMGLGERRPLPIFQGRKVAPRRLNTVLVCDPSLYLDPSVRVGWFLGNRHCPMQEVLPAIMDHLDRIMGAQRRVLWGNSAGGFAAIRYARSDDLAVAVNPQTVLRQFIWGWVMPWLEQGWDARDRRSMRALADRIGDLRGQPLCRRLVYVQNRHDNHVARHLAPFALAHGLTTEPGDDGRFRLILGDWREGHFPPPSRWQRRLILEETARLCPDERSWLARLGLRRFW